MSCSVGGDISVFSVKEKFGGLRIDGIGIDDLESELEERSHKICEECGKPIAEEYTLCEQCEMYVYGTIDGQPVNLPEDAA